MAATPAICAKDMRIFACQLCGASIDRTASGYREQYLRAGYEELEMSSLWRD